MRRRLSCHHLPGVVALSLLAAPGSARGQDSTERFDQLQRGSAASWIFSPTFGGGHLRTQASFYNFHVVQMSQYAAEKQILRQMMAEASFQAVATILAQNAESAIARAMAETYQVKSCGTNYGAQYQVPFGHYTSDGLVSVRERALSSLNSEQRRNETCYNIAQGVPSAGRTADTGGWSFEPGGMVRQTWETVRAQSAGCPHPSPFPGPCNADLVCEVVPHVGYASRGQSYDFLPMPAENSCTFTLPSINSFNQYAEVCRLQAASHCALPTQYQSTSGQVLLDLSDANVAVARFPDGNTERLGRKPAGAERAFNLGPRWFVGDTAPPTSGTAEGVFWFTDSRTGPNGNRTTFQYDGAGWVVGMTDPAGRTTQFQRGPQARIEAIDVPGSGGELMRWQLAWSQHTWNVGLDFDGANVCNLPEGTSGFWSCGAPTDIYPPRVGSCSPIQFTTLDSLTLPDARRFTFTYGN